MDSRRDPRYPVQLKVHVTSISAPTRCGEGTITEISKAGLRLQTSFPLAVSEFLQIDIEGGSLWATVAFVRQDNLQSFTAGLEIEQILLGGSELSQLLRGLLDEAVADSEQVLR